MKPRVFYHWTNGKEWRTLRTQTRYEPADDLSMIGYL
jgi:hypothetical protein